MQKMTVEEITSVVGGQLLCGDPQTVITNVQYDSREVGEGSLFVPIKGEKVDAHKFIPQCMEKGAATFTEYDAPEGAEKPYIKVGDTRLALQKLAAGYRSGFPALKLAGVTGSVGKTSTKEMIAAALSGGLVVMKTSGNKNSQIGMPMTMFDIAPEHQAAVIEMGMSEFGEMDRLCDVSRPNIAVMTNIGNAHIENLKTRENIRSEKLKITKHFDNEGILFLNGDDELLRVTGRKTTCLRPPGGSCNDTVKKAVDCPIILWSIDTEDWKSRNANKICNRVIGKVKDGDIVLMHDLYESTAEATKKIVPALVKAGFQLVTVEEMGLLKQGGLEKGVVYYSIEKR